MLLTTAVSVTTAVFISFTSAATVLPSKPQLEWQLNDTGCFVHYNMVGDTVDVDHMLRVVTNSRGDALISTPYPHLSALRPPWSGCKDARTA